MTIELQDTVEIEELWAAVVSGRVSYLSYAALNASTSRPFGSIAEVQGDGGTHVDPVSALVVDNEGVYRRVDAGWERIADIPATLIAEVEAFLAALALGLETPKITVGPTPYAGGTGGGVLIDILPAEDPIIDDADIDIRVPSRFFLRYTPFNQGPVGRVNYVCTSLGWGFNNELNNTPSNPDLPSGVDFWEGPFFQGGSDIELLERHISIIPTDSSDELRVISIQTPAQQANWQEHSLIFIQSSLQTLMDGSGVACAKWTFSIPTSRRLDMFDEDAQGHATIHFWTNNKPTTRQQRAAGGAVMLDLPYFDDSDNVRFSDPITLTGAFKRSAVLGGPGAGPKSIVAMQASGAAANDYCQYINSSSVVVGDLNADFFDGNVSGSLISTVRNNHATGKAAFDAVAAGGGEYRVNGVRVLNDRKTGWALDTGTAKRTANATYSGIAEAGYTQATIQALMDAVRDLSETVKALKDDLHATAGMGILGA